MGVHIWDLSLFQATNSCVCSELAVHLYHHCNHSRIRLTNAKSPSVCCLFWLCSTKTTTSFLTGVIRPHSAIQPSSVTVGLTLADTTVYFLSIIPASYLHGKNIGHRTLHFPHHKYQHFLTSLFKLFPACYCFMIWKRKWVYTYKLWVITLLELMEGTAMAGGE